MLSKSQCFTCCIAFCQNGICALLGENGRAVDPEDVIGWQQSQVVMWPSGQALHLHAYALYWAIGVSSNVLYLIISLWEKTAARISAIDWGRIGKNRFPLSSHVCTYLKRSMAMSVRQKRGNPKIRFIQRSNWLTSWYFPQFAPSAAHMFVLMFWTNYGIIISMMLGTHINYSLLKYLFS
jgi:hypothetical protein